MVCEMRYIKNFLESILCDLTHTACCWKYIYFLFVAWWCLQFVHVTWIFDKLNTNAMTSPPNYSPFPRLSHIFHTGPHNSNNHRTNFIMIWHYNTLVNVITVCPISVANAFTIYTTSPAVSKVRSKFHLFIILSKVQFALSNCFRSLAYSHSVPCRAKMMHN